MLSEGPELTRAHALRLVLETKNRAAGRTLVRKGQRIAAFAVGKFEWVRTVSSSPDGAIWHFTPSSKSFVFDLPYISYDTILPKCAQA